MFVCLSGNVRIGVARPSAEDYEEEGTGESPPDSARYNAELQLDSDVQGNQRESEYH